MSIYLARLIQKKNSFQNVQRHYKIFQKLFSIEDERKLTLLFKSWPTQQRYPFPEWPYFFIAQMNNLNQILKSSSGSGRN